MSGCQPPRTGAASQTPAGGRDIPRVVFRGYEGQDLMQRMGGRARLEAIGHLRGPLIDSITSSY